jgi:hypothetical protein
LALGVILYEDALDSVPCRGCRRLQSDGGVAGRATGHLPRRHVDTSQASDVARADPGSDAAADPAIPATADLATAIVVLSDHLADE